MMCDIKKCKKPTYLFYYSHNICRDHWVKHCDSEYDLKKELKIKEEKQITL